MSRKRIKKIQIRILIVYVKTLHEFWMSTEKDNYILKSIYLFGVLVLMSLSNTFPVKVPLNYPTFSKSRQFLHSLYNKMLLTDRVSLFSYHFILLQCYFVRKKVFFVHGAFPVLMQYEWIGLSWQKFTTCW